MPSSIPSSMPSSIPNSMPSQTLDGRFELLAPLGTGGMGEVYRARERSSGALMAVKVLRNQASPSLRARFLRGARLASQIYHPHIIRVRNHSRGSEQLYLVMDLVKGFSLTDLIEASISNELLCALLLQVLGALAHVHARGILHRDIKPDNILIARTPEGSLHAWLTDFGAAGLVEYERGVTRLTQEGSMLGTPGFVAPEQIMNCGHLNPSADLYPIGVILYHAVSGRMPFEGSMWTVLTAKSTQDTPPPSNPDSWPEGLWCIVEHLLARDPAQRFCSASEVIAALLPFAPEAKVSIEEWDRITAVQKGRLDPFDTLFGASVSLFSDANSAFAPSPSTGESLDELWGREEVMEELLEIAIRAEQRTLQVVLLDGPMGSGKSFLSRQLGLRLAEAGRFSLMQGDYLFHNTGDGLRLALERAMGTIGKPPSEVKERVGAFLKRHGVEDDLEQQSIMEFLRPPLVQTNPKDRWLRRSHHALILRLLCQMSKTQPLLLILNDVQHDAVDFVNFVENAIIETSYEAFPLMILATLRKEESATVFVPLNRFLVCDRIQHLSLGAIKAEVLAAVLARDHELPFIEALWIAERAGGNPLFAQLLAQSDRPNSVDERPLPEQLQSLMMERFEKSLRIYENIPCCEKDPKRCSTLLRSLAKRVAILGEPIEVELLELFSQDLDIHFDEALDTLIQSGVLSEEFQTGALRFRHPLLCEALSLSVQGRKARRLHLRAAQLCEVFALGEVEAQAMAIGDHYILARQVEEAISWWLRGVQREISTGDFRRAIHCGVCALEHLKEQDFRTTELRKTIARLLREEGANMERVSEMLCPLMEQGPDIAQTALEIIAEMQQDLSDFEGWTATIAKMRDIAAQSTSDTTRHSYERVHLYWLNNNGKCSESQRLARAYLDAEPTRPDALYILNRLIWAIVISHSFDPSADLDFDFSDLIRELDRHMKTISDPKCLVDALRTRAAYCFRQWDLDGGLRALDETIDLCRRTGHHARLMYVSGEKIFILLQDNRFEESKALIAQVRKMGMDPERSVRIPVFDYMAHILSRTPPSKLLSKEIDSFTHRVSQLTDLTSVMSLSRILLFQAQALFSAELGDWNQVHEKLSALPFFILGWGLPYELISRLGAALLQHLAEHPNDDRMLRLTEHYLESSKKEWCHEFSTRDDSFIVSMIGELRTIQRTLEGLSDRKDAS